MRDKRITNIYSYYIVYKKANSRDLGYNEDSIPELKE